MEKVRESNFELLRIISCFMIIILHYLNGGMGGALSNVKEGSLNFYFSHSLESLCIVGVNCFIIITGYFMIKKTEIYSGKVVKLFITLLFYSLMCFIIAICLKITSFNFKELILAIIPFLAGRRWFISSYIILFLFIPYINKVLNSISKKDYQIFLIIYIIFFSIWPTFFTAPPINDGGYGIVNFILLYSLGGYVKLHINNVLDKRICFVLYVVFAFFSTIMSFFFVERAWNYNNIFNIIGALMLFLFFLNIKIYSKFINNVSKLSFGIFILHSDPMLRGTFYSIMKCRDYYESVYFVLHLLICCFLSYVFFGIIDYVKEKIFSKTIYKFIDKNKFLNFKIKA